MVTNTHKHRDTVVWYHTVTHTHKESFVVVCLLQVEGTMRCLRKVFYMKT